AARMLWAARTACRAAPAGPGSRRRTRSAGAVTADRGVWLSARAALQSPPATFFFTAPGPGRFSRPCSGGRDRAVLTT
ncbi:MULTISPECIES: hypothetical protein, partial [unclassified Streptomyces]|uniref:hypothetical protein n=1 Tax=unclassified Streptomyces TaxID=2593676 RepID=UPI0019601E3F